MNATRVPIRITTRIICPCGADYVYGELGPDRELYDAWVAAHLDHWGNRP